MDVILIASWPDSGPTKYRNSHAHATRTPNCAPAVRRHFAPGNLPIAFTVWHDLDSVRRHCSGQPLLTQKQLLAKFCAIADHQQFGMAVDQWRKAHSFAAMQSYRHTSRS
jgi:hypothetical protein